ncbi:MAG TPA: Holliday junction resolvase RuvX [Chitinophagales bacterium]|nr:Holliday junction resolvase RuvX [Chitinophagales bacterium]
MPRILAIDFGSKRAGLAVTDPLQIIASPLAAVAAKDVLDFIKDYIAKEPVECFVIGEPRNLDGTATHATPLVEKFIQSLKKTFPTIPVKTMDESFTSKTAARALAEGNFKKKERRKKENLDKISATLILQSYMQTIKQ